MMRAAALVALVAVFATGAGTAAAQQPHRTTAAGRWLADRLEGRDLIRPEPTVPEIGTFSMDPGRFGGPGGFRTFSRGSGDSGGPVRIVPVWRPREIRCVPGLRCPS